MLVSHLFDLVPIWLMLTDRRSPVATITLTVAFSAVIILITDLDRPVKSFFDINDQLLVGPTNPN
jgi:hypothetical protein